MAPARLHLDAPGLLLRDPSPLVTLLSSAFLHSGWLHFLSNMWVLGVFGDNVEDRMGRSGLLVLCVERPGGQPAAGPGLPAQPGARHRGQRSDRRGAGQLFPVLPVGHVSLTLIPIFFIPWFVQVRAIVFLGFWFVTQLYSGLFSLRVPSGTMGGVAWWAHIGGFLFGVAAAKVFDQGAPFEERPEE